MQHKVVCIGAGPAGLTAAYLLTKNNIPTLVLEKDASYVGGISRTVDYKGYLCDIGGHRFFSKSQEITSLWREILDEGFIERPRKSRIFYNRKFFDYPLKAFDALSKLGIVESGLCVLSYLAARLSPVQHPANFQEWVSNKFGKRLFRIFFKTYTEKVWGMPCTAISADWAAQRIKGLSLGSAIRNALFAPKDSTKGYIGAKTLITHFHYPRKGPGMMWDAAARKITAQGGEVRMNSCVTACRFNGTLWHIDVTTGGTKSIITAEHIITSNPLSEMIAGLSPAAPEPVRAAASNLKYRDFLIVGLIVTEREAFNDNWIYIHDPDVKVGRIQNFKAWSPEMVPDAKTNCYGMEYFCFEHDGMWQMQDAELTKLASAELVKLGLVKGEDIREGFVIRQQKAYPVYDDAYKKHLQAIEPFLKTYYPTLHPVGRNGMHRYNNQDHSMMTAILTVKNILAGKEVYNTWHVNEDAEYHEEISADRLVPART